MYENGKQEFLDLFYRYIFPYLAQCEKERIKWIIISIITTIGCIILSYIFTLWCFEWSLEPIYLIIALTIFAGIIFSYFCNSIIARIFKKSINNKFMDGILSYFCNIKHTNISHKIYKELKKALGNKPIFNHGIFNFIGPESYWTGRYKDIEFSLSKVVMGNPRFGVLLDFNIDIPKGLIVFNKNLWKEQNSTILIVIMSALFLFCILFSIYCCIRWGFNGEFLISLPTAVVLGGVALYLFKSDSKCAKEIFNNENAVSLGNQYYAISENNDDISKFLKPDLINLLKNTKSCFKSKENPYLQTYDNNGQTGLSVLIPTNINAFEICSLYKPMTKPKSMDTFFNQLSCIMDLIDYFADLENKSRD